MTTLQYQVGRGLLKKSLMDGPELGAGPDARAAATGFTKALEIKTNYV